MAFRSSATTHVGMVRKVNQDAFAERSDIGVWVVADGMGGHEAGDCRIYRRRIAYGPGQGCAGQRHGHANLRQELSG